MINLTRQERLVLIFLGLAFLSGIAFKICFKQVDDSANFYSSIIKNNLNFKLNSIRKPNPVRNTISNGVNINLANKENLMKLTGIGPVLAQRIIDYRFQHGPFLNIEDIIQVEGIGKRKFEQIKDFLIVSEK